jgi:uncharacterized protein (DUF1501 family)
MDTMTRRRFLLRSGVVAGGAVAAGAAGLASYTLWDILATADDPARGPGDRTLVLVTLYGGNDGLATVVPYADAAYHDARPGLSYEAGQVLRIDDATGLNPSLKGLHREYGSGRLAIVRGVGYPKPDRSHFRSMDIWQTANPVRPEHTGWLGRWLDGAGGDPRLAVSFEPVLPPVLAGQRSAGASVSVGGLALPKGMPSATVAALGRPSTGEPALQARAASCLADLLEIDKMITGVSSESTSDDDLDDDTPAATATGGGHTPLAAQLGLVAQCVEAGVSTRVFSVSLGGFDFHADEREAQERILGELDAAVTSFVDRMAKSDRGRKVVVMIYSEFGRRVRANASDGTDHGTASNVFVVGPKVAGGRLIGEQPSLTDLDDGDLKFSTDFRDVYAAMLSGVLGADPGAILSNWPGMVPELLAS